MIHNEQELKGTKERIAYLERLLGQLRVTARPEEFPLAANGYRAEIERMQAEVLDYLTRHISEPVPAQVAWRPAQSPDRPSPAAWPCCHRVAHA